jgi:type I restriction enzyme S subunit
VNPPWPKARLGAVLRRSEESIRIEPDASYREITVKLWGKGVVQRGVIVGAAVAAQRRYVARSDQFILSRIDARNGALGVVPKELDGAIVSGDFPLFDVNLDRLLPAFLGWMCRTAPFVEACQRASEGTTNRVRIQEDQLLATEIPLPPLAEQRHIVERLGALAAQICAACELRSRASEELMALAAARAATLFRNALRNGTERLDALAKLERGKFSYRPRNEPRFFGGGHPWIQIGEIESSDKFIRVWTETLNDEGLAISKKFPRGTVLISIAATIGAVGILDFDSCVPDSIVGVTPRPGNDSEFLYYYLRYLRGHLEELAPQSAQKNINLQILAGMPVPRLSLAEQRRVAAELNLFQGEVDTLRRLHREGAAELNAMLSAVHDRAFDQL